MKFAFIPCVFAAAACSHAPVNVVPKTPVERQMIGLLEKFDRWDLNGNGKLSAKELKAGEKATGRPVGQILEFYDVDRDGSVTLKEAQKGYARVDEAEAKARE